MARKVYICSQTNQIDTQQAAMVEKSHPPIAACFGDESGTMVRAEQCFALLPNLSSWHLINHIHSILYA
ncbi:hypothetical protein CPB83DRAFT_863250 [Crepidotus variabilis]|uniref:Uncharacterized protein n=1 Tax=Crepidotus variabilis TaxID=179855 RepID=A0A9P6E638_9AGAR|nr:hypothetical protein CPB83DRAFT_863250 [Crepidotus variabilis]